MGVGLSAQGVNMNRLPGKIKYSLYTICLHAFSKTKLQVGINIHMVIMAMMAIRFAQAAQVNHTDQHLPLVILLVVESI